MQDDAPRRRRRSLERGRHAAGLTRTELSRRRRDRRAMLARIAGGTWSMVKLAVEILAGIEGIAKVASWVSGWFS